jgi:tetratricopeptide (TPR) repeat protein
MEHSHSPSTAQSRNWLHFILLLLAVLLAYSKIFNAGFMNWDDPDYVFHTPDISSGIGWQQIKNWFSSYYIGNYQPLPVFTYALDHLIGGENPLVYHLDNLIWHIADTFLVYLFIGRLQRNNWVSLFVALLFALHPVQTESVSWIAARNKGMNTFFYLSTLLVYTHYVYHRSAKKMIWILVLGLAAYLCKATALSLPLALFAVDIWLERPFKNSGIWLEKLPLVLLGLPIVWATLHAQQQVDFLDHHQAAGFNAIIYAGYAFTSYIGQLLAPVHLSVLYPYPPSVGIVHYVYLVIAVAVVALIPIAYKKRWFPLAGGLLFFTVNMLPVLQFVQFGETIMANRYLYGACIGLFYPAIYYLFWWLDSKSKQLVAILLSVGLCGTLLVATFLRNDIWLSEVNFWSSVIEKFPDAPVAQYSLGGAYLKAGNLVQAEEYLNNATLLAPDNYKAWYNKGMLYIKANKPMEAMDALNRCIALNSYPKALLSRALLFQSSGRPELAIADADKVIATQPDNSNALHLKADGLDQMGKTEEAVNYYSKAISIADNDPILYLRRGLAQAKLNKPEIAIHDINRSIELKPNNGEAYYYRALVKYRNNINACQDLQMATRNGYPQAQELLTKLCNQ